MPYLLATTALLHPFIEDYQTLRYTLSIILFLLNVQKRAECRYSFYLLCDVFLPFCEVLITILTAIITNFHDEDALQVLQRLGFPTQLMAYSAIYLSPVVAWFWRIIPK